VRTVSRRHRLFVTPCLFAFLVIYPSGTLLGQSSPTANEDRPVFLQDQLIERSFKAHCVKKAPGHYSASDWAAVIDSAWGTGLSTADKLNIFDTFWNTIDQEFACFQDLDVNWDSLGTVYRDEIATGVSRGRFAAIMNHLSLALRESHTRCVDRTVSWFTSLDPGVPLLVVGGWGLNDHFGACLTPLPDGSLLVYKSIQGHPLGLVPGDIVLGYDGVPWSVLCEQLINAQLPIASARWGCSNSAYEHSWLMSAGMNWHLFDTIDIVRYATGDTLHLSTASLAGLTTHIFGSEQLDVAGVPKPDPMADDYVSWGIVSGTQIGYIYVMGWKGNAGGKFYEAVDDIMFNHTTSGLIIDFRTNFGGNMFLSNDGLALLFNTTVPTIGLAERSDPNNHLAMTVSADPSFYYIEGDPSTFYDKPIAVLTGPGAFSSGDQVALRMKFHPRARIFGKSTSAAFNAPSSLDLGNSDWSSRYATADAYLVSDPGHYLTHDEFVVDEPVWLTRDDVAQGIDTVVEAAIDWINGFAATLLERFHAEVRWPTIEIVWTLQEIDQGIGFTVTRSDNGGSFAEVDVDIVETAERSWTCLDRGIYPGREYIYRVYYDDGGERHFLFETAVLSTPAAGLTLSPNYPNPFNPSTRIDYYIPEPSDVRLVIYDVNGRRIRTLVSTGKSAGGHAVEWDGRDDLGSAVASGVYLCRLEMGKARRTIKMVLLK
jgi:hypothetical protein